MTKAISNSHGQYVEMPSGPNALQITDVAVPLISKQAADKFDAILKNVVRRQLGQGEAAERALASGSFLMKDLTVVMRFNRGSDCIEVYVDMGLPDSSADQARIFGSLLAMNLHNTHEGIL